MDGNFPIMLNVKARDFTQNVIISYPFEGIITTMSFRTDLYIIDLVVSSIYSGRVIEKCHFKFKDMDQCLEAQETLSEFVASNCKDSLSYSGQIECEDFSISFNNN